ncbi:MAG: hypothetical protein JHC33_05120 [Ignisphaera sp.]|nr:hypothetical protein [Ignisphaera sp.]
MRINDMIHLKGEVLIQAVNVDGKISTIVEDKNLIVSAGRENICNFLVGGASSAITDIAFGSGGTITGNPNVAISVNPSEETLATPIAGLHNNIDYLFTRVAQTSPSPRAVFSTVIPSSSLSDQTEITQLNGQSISELGLMMNTTPTAKTFAIKRFPAISKSDIISLIITWIIYV